jgi:Amt family ammonium transporter
MYRGLFLFMFFIACLAGTSVFAQEDRISDLRLGLDLTWIMAAGALVMFMQVGFLLLEAGMVRSKNSINVAQKNMLDFVFAVAAFAIGGFMIAFAHSSTFLPGFDLNYIALNGLNSWEAGFFVFQIMFCGTAATIVSGAVAERMKLSAYIWGSLFLSGFIYPVWVHWSWGAALGENPGAFLGNAGFVDFAGSTAVHATGGWVSLAACMIIGAREGRFDENGNPVRMTGHSPVLATTGALILFIGWIGFNGGSTLRANADMAMIILNTVLAGGFGACAGYLMGTWTDGVVLPEKSLSGMLGGLVAVTAGCHVLTPAGAVVIGVAGGVIAIWGNDFVERRLKIDDAVGAIGVHAFAGVLGTVGLALLAPASKLIHGSRLEQLEIQIYGSVANFIWSFGVGYAFFWLLNRFLKLRVSLETERGGLNIAEHATHIGTGHMEEALSQLISGNADFRMRLPVDRGSDSEFLTRLFNRLMDNLEVEHAELSQLENLKRQSEEAERVSALSNATFEAIVMHKEGQIIDCNEQMAMLVGVPIEELPSYNLLTFLDPKYQDMILDYAMNKNGSIVELELLGKDGTRIPVAARGKSINYRGEEVRVECIVDLRERKAHEEQILRMANQDPLTGLANRSLFAQHLEKAIELSGIGFSSALVMVDLDRFKAVNDVHGHHAGDIVLREAADRLRELAGNGGVAARLGGDEFAIIRYGVEFENQAADLGLRIVRSMARPIDIGGTHVTIGSSVGIAICPTHGDTTELLSSRADVALYHSKKSGRNTYNIFRAGLDELLEKRRSLEADLERAVVRGEMELHFQPRVDSKTLAVKSFEALIRWRHPTRGMISPADFIPVAEACGKIIEIGEWVLTEGIAALNGPLKDASVSLNVSPLQFQQRNFVETVERAISFSGIDPARVELELTESMLIDDEGRGQTVMRKLKALGVKTALDDFGTGYSSLSYLSKYPFDTIKIDKAFVTALESEANGASILNAIINLGAGLGMKIVAEGVETVEQAVFLIDAGCDQLQGFLLGRPQPMESLAREIPVPVRDEIDAALDARFAERQASALRKLAFG